MEKGRLLVLNHFTWVPELDGQFEEVLFAPRYYSENQRNFFERQCSLLKERVPRLEWVKALELKEGDRVLAVNASHEKRAFGTNLLPIKNRLFSELTFAIPEGFSAFRKKAEPLLPDHFSEAILPYDSDLLSDLNRYFEGEKLALSYFETRNGFVGRDYSTKISAHLACGALDVRYFYNRIKEFEREFESNKSTYWLVFELLWREFFYWHYQKHGNRYFSENGLRDPLDFSPYKYYEFEELRQMGLHPYMEAALNELEQTGFLGNRMRQMFASFWLNELDLNWRSGAHFLEENLVDYDVFSNYGNWMYLAGVGVDPRGKRHFNFEKQIQNYDPENTYLKAWLG